jgi:hypothetical protein
VLVLVAFSPPRILAQARGGARFRGGAAAISRRPRRGEPTSPDNRSDGPRHPGHSEGPLTTMPTSPTGGLGRGRQEPPCSDSQRRVAPEPPPRYRIAHPGALRSSMMTTPTAPWNQSGRDSATNRVSPRRPHSTVAPRRYRHTTPTPHGLRIRRGPSVPPVPGRAPHRVVQESVERDESFGAPRGLR